MIFYEPKESNVDLKVFSDAFTGHFQVVMSCLEQTDKDLQVACKMTQNLLVELIGAAQMVASQLATTAFSALDKLPTLLWAARGHGNAEAHACTEELHDSLSALRRDTQSVRTDYIELLKRLQYLGHCAQVTVDQTVVQSMGEPVEDATLCLRTPKE